MYLSDNQRSVESSVKTEFTDVMHSVCNDHIVFQRGSSVDSFYSNGKCRMCRFSFCKQLILQTDVTVDQFTNHDLVQFHYESNLLLVVQFIAK